MAPRAEHSGASPRRLDPDVALDVLALRLFVDGCKHREIIAALRAVARRLEKRADANGW